MITKLKWLRGKRKTNQKPGDTVTCVSTCRGEGREVVEESKMSLIRKCRVSAL